MIRVQLDEAQRAELQSLRRSPLPPRSRERLEAVLLADAGWSAPRIAAHLGRDPQTVRALLRDFAARGVPALSPRPTGPAPDAARRGRALGPVRGLPARPRGWT